MEELKELLRFVFPLALLAALALFQLYFRRSFGGGAGKAPGVPPARPTPERIQPEPTPVPAPAEEERHRPQRPETPRGPERSAAPALGGSAPDRDVRPWRPGMHLRRLLADPRGRPVVILAHEILRKPVGCWWDERRR